MVVEVSKTLHIGDHHKATTQLVAMYKTELLTRYNLTPFVLHYNLQTCISFRTG